MKKQCSALFWMILSFLLLTACSAKDMTESVELIPEYISNDSLLLSLDAGDGCDMQVKLWKLDDAEWSLMNVSVISAKGQDMLTLDFGRMFKGLTVLTETDGGYSLNPTPDSTDGPKGFQMYIRTIQESVLLVPEEDVPIIIQAFGEGDEVADISPEMFNEPESLNEYCDAYVLSLCVQK